jgi:hypothetical protein
MITKSNLELNEKDINDNLNLSRSQHFINIGHHHLDKKNKNSRSTGALEKIYTQHQHRQNDLDLKTNDNSNLKPSTSKRRLFDFYSYYNNKYNQENEKNYRKMGSYHHGLRSAASSSKMDYIKSNEKYIQRRLQDYLKRIYNNHNHHHQHKHDNINDNQYQNMETNINNNETKTIHSSDNYNNNNKNEKATSTPFTM